MADKKYYIRVPEALVEVSEEVYKASRYMDRHLQTLKEKDMRNRVVIEESEAAIVRLIFERFLSGYSKEEIASELRDREYPTRADVSEINASNILNHITETVQQSLKEYKLHKTDLLRAIHLVDTDGAYIPDSAIVFDEHAIKPVYGTTNIKTANPEWLIQRNQKKKANLTKLHSAQFIWKDIPYSVYYFSSNLEHALYGELNLTDEEKETRAVQFAKRYIYDIPAFVEYVRNSEFAVVNGYLPSWAFIKQDLHSLERHSNIGICFS